jgi:nucleoside-diphosphate-sugar epimerase
VLNHPHTIGRDYNLSGGQVLTYNQVIETAARALGRSPLILHLPAQPIIYLLETLERFHLPLPLKGEQIRRLNEDKTFSHSFAQQDFGYHPRGFARGIAMEVELLKEGRRATGAGRKGE